MLDKARLALPIFLQTSLILGVTGDVAAHLNSLQLTRGEKIAKENVREEHLVQVSHRTSARRYSTFGADDIWHRRNYDYVKLQGYQDSECKESIDRSGYIIAGGTDIKDGSCVHVSAADSEYNDLLMNQSRTLGLLVDCSTGDTKLEGVRLGITFGDQCQGGFDDQMTAILTSEEAVKLGRGECAEADNADEHQAYWMRLKHIENIKSLPPCLLPWGSGTNWRLIGGIGGSVFLVLLCLSGIFLHVTKSRKKKKKEPAPASTEQPASDSKADEADDASREPDETPRGSLLLDSGDDLAAPTRDSYHEPPEEYGDF
mmetsp:Transcript_6137/g.11338  ORF Transcript_6137/g.11338 Transcript_6137/m.11338 type:complete len:315 (+) Transcript_6137:32-976(+)